jgi:hypothetical protein
MPPGKTASAAHWNTAPKCPWLCDFPSIKIQAFFLYFGIEVVSDRVWTDILMNVVWKIWKARNDLTLGTALLKIFPVSTSSVNPLSFGDFDLDVI